MNTNSWHYKNIGKKNTGCVQGVRPNKIKFNRLPATMLVVWAVLQKEKKVIIAYTPGTNPTNPNSLVAVKAANNSNFVVGLPLWARQEKGNVYKLIRRISLKRQRRRAISGTAGGRVNDLPRLNWPSHLRTGNRQCGPRWRRVCLNRFLWLLYDAPVAQKWQWQAKPGWASAGAQLVNPRGMVWDVKFAGGIWIRRHLR